MEKLIEQLENNISAFEHLNNRIENIKTMEFFRIFSTEQKREREINWVLKIQKRILRMRYRILENINLETQKQMNYTSQMSRDLTLKTAQNV